LGEAHLVQLLVTSVKLTILSGSKISQIYKKTNPIPSPIKNIESFDARKWQIPNDGSTNFHKNTSSMIDDGLANEACAEFQLNFW
jgi:hypothetical protein